MSSINRLVNILRVIIFYIGVLSIYACTFFLGVYGSPAWLLLFIALIALPILFYRWQKQKNLAVSSFHEILKLPQLKTEIHNLENTITVQADKIARWAVVHEDMGFTRYDEITDLVEQTKKDHEDLVLKNEQEIQSLQKEIQSSESMIRQLEANISMLQIDKETQKDELDKIAKKALTHTRKIERSKELYRAIAYSADREATYMDDSIMIDLDDLFPTVTLKLHHMDIKQLRQSFRDNEKQITTVVEAYRGRYTTKANQTIYSLMVIALRAELQNILYNLKYEKLDDAISQVKIVITKYQKIAEEGNQSIAGTLRNFIGEIEYLFINAVKIEYNYYVKREQTKQEQIAIKQKAREEAAERKALEQEKRRVEAEEAKYQAEIIRNQELLSTASEAEAELINKRLLELNSQLSDVVLKKEEISNLQMGKAGTVYIISNAGAFGDNVFKIGMTRRLDPQERINELASAAVPFKFDVHSFIFSEDAVSLENAIHKQLNDKRVNKVNMRKEFFHTDIEELETLVNELDPTAEFNSTMAAEEFNQSLSSTENYDVEMDDDYFDEEELEDAIEVEV